MLLRVGDVAVRDCFWPCCSSLSTSTACENRLRFMCVIYVCDLCVCVCVFVCTYIHDMYVCMYVYMHTHTHTHIYTHTCTPVCSMYSSALSSAPTTSTRSHPHDAFHKLYNVQAQYHIYSDSASTLANHRHPLACEVPTRLQHVGLGIPELRLPLLEMAISTVHFSAVRLLLSV
jgi:hypothetical protein